jgi:ribosome-binding protein aMBF1 (putative translation factor)
MILKNISSSLLIKYILHYSNLKKEEISFLCMETCRICGVGEDQRRLVDALASNGVAKVCEDCAYCLDMPLLKKPTTKQVNTSAGVGVSVYDRMARDRGLDPEQHKRNAAKYNERNYSLEKENIQLREVMKKNYENKLITAKPMPRPDLVDNFNWKIMRARRLKKYTVEQLAYELGESELTMRLVEKGVLPNDDNKLISKLQVFLDIDLIKEGSSGGIRKSDAQIKFDRYSARNITLGQIKQATPQKKRLSQIRVENMRLEREAKEMARIGNVLQSVQENVEVGLDDVQEVEEKVPLSKKILGFFGLGKEKKEPLVEERVEEIEEIEEKGEENSELEKK